jgi:hypothetical protein
VPGQHGVGAFGDDAQDPARGREVLRREGEELRVQLLDGTADALVHVLAGIGESQQAGGGCQPGGCQFGDRQPGGGQLGDGRFDLGAVDLPGRRYPGDELAAVGAAAAGRGDGEDQPLLEGDAGVGQQRLEQSAEGALSLADDLRVERGVARHGVLLGLNIRWLFQRWQSQR